MANRKLRVLLKKKYADGSIDTIYFRTRPADVIDEQGNVLTTYISKLDNVSAGATKVEASATNGKIKIDGTATTVYEHPTSGVTAGSYNYVTVDTEGHVTAAENKSYLLTNGDGSSVTTTFTTAQTRANVATGETLATSLGKISKFFTDLGSLAFASEVGTSNLDSTLSTFYGKALTTDNVTDSTAITADGWVADAKVIKTLKDSIDTINGNFEVYVPNRNWLYEGKEINLTWAQISAKLATGDTTFMKTGDYKTIALTNGETVIMEFAGWTYTNGYGSNYKNFADFISRDCLATPYRMNATNTQEGGFAATELLTKLKKNGEIYNKLPSDLKPYIGLKRVFGLQYVQSDNNKYNSAHHTWSEFDGLWLPTEIEVFGHRSCSCVCYDTSKQYDIFKHEKHIIKRLGNGGSLVLWWEASPAFTSSSNFCLVDDSGYATTTGASSLLGVPICYRISST